MNLSVYIMKLYLLKIILIFTKVFKTNPQLYPLINSDGMKEDKRFVLYIYPLYFSLKQNRKYLQNCTWLKKINLRILSEIIKIKLFDNKINT